MIPVRDSFGRVHDYLRISLTERCNLRCFYCMPEKGIPIRERAVFMRQEEILDLAKIFVRLGVKKIRLTGGEPLVRKDAHQIIRKLSGLPVSLCITTNGILVDEYIGTFRSANISCVNVSLDSLKSDRQHGISRRDYFERIISNIELLLKNDFKVKVNAVIMKDVNDDEIIDFVKWTKDQPLDIRFIEFMPFNGNKWNWGKKVSFNEIMEMIALYFTREKVISLPDKFNNTAKNYRIEGYKGSFGIIGSVTNPFCSTCNRIRLSADGMMTNCLFSNDKTDLLTPLRDGRNVEDLIRNSILGKSEQRAGIDSFEAISSKYKNRSMVAIGG